MSKKTPIQKEIETEELLMRCLQRCRELEIGIKTFVDKNFVSVDKLDKEDYMQMVSAKDINDLRKLL